MIESRVLNNEGFPDTVSNHRWSFTDLFWKNMIKDRMNGILQTFKKTIIYEFIVYRIFRF